MTEESRGVRDLGLVLVAAGLGALGGFVARPGVSRWWFLAYGAALLIGLGILFAPNLRIWRARRSLLRGTRGWSADAVTAPGVEEYAVVLRLRPPKTSGDVVIHEAQLHCSVRVPTGEWVEMPYLPMLPCDGSPYYTTTFPTGFDFERAGVSLPLPQGRLIARWYRKRSVGSQTLATATFRIGRDGTFDALVVTDEP